jgi:uncharacterized SAM-binding protein YcdF (DUF218 family)
METITYYQPFFPTLLVITVVGVLLRDRVGARRFFCGCAIGLFLFTWRPAAWTALWFFERPYASVATAPPKNKDVQAIVVLASSMWVTPAPASAAFLGTDTTRRCLYAAWLHANWHAVPVLASGGGSQGIPVAVAMRQELENAGVPSQMIWTEEHSRSTYENAVESARFLKQRGIYRIALVTEAYHMPRAERCFRKQGLEVIPAPCDFRATVQGHVFEFIPDAEVISWNEDTMHETIGLIWYWLRGRI